MKLVAFEPILQEQQFDQYPVKVIEEGEVSG